MFLKNHWGTEFLLIPKKELKLIFPLEGFSKETINFNKVVLPQPELPIIETNSLWEILKLMSSITFNS